MVVNYDTASYLAGTEYRERTAMGVTLQTESPSFERSGSYVKSLLASFLTVIKSLTSCEINIETHEPRLNILHSNQHIHILT